MCKLRWHSHLCILPQELVKNVNGLVLVLELPGWRRAYYVILAIDYTFYGFSGVITHAGCWENTRKAFFECSSNIPSRLSRSNPIESVVYFFYKITLNRMFQFSMSLRAQ